MDTVCLGNHRDAHYTRKTLLIQMPLAESEWVKGWSERKRVKRVNVCLMKVIAMNGLRVAGKCWRAQLGEEHGQRITVTPSACLLAARHGQVDARPCGRTKRTTGPLGEGQHTREVRHC